MTDGKINPSLPKFKPAPAEAIKTPPEKVRVSDVRARLEKLVNENGGLKTHFDPVNWLMKEEMRVTRNGLNPIDLRSLCSVVWYKRDVVARLLERLLMETSHMRAFTEQEQSAELDEIEKVANTLIAKFRSTHNESLA